MEEEQGHLETYEERINYKHVDRIEKSELLENKITSGDQKEEDIKIKEDLLEKHNEEEDNNTVPVINEEMLDKEHASKSILEPSEEKKANSNEETIEIKKEDINVIKENVEEINDVKANGEEINDVKVNEETDQGIPSHNSNKKDPKSNNFNESNEKETCQEIKNDIKENKEIDQSNLSHHSVKMDPEPNNFNESNKKETCQEIKNDVKEDVNQSNPSHNSIKKNKEPNNSNGSNSKEKSQKKKIKEKAKIRTTEENSMTIGKKHNKETISIGDKVIVEKLKENESKSQLSKKERSQSKSHKKEIEPFYYKPKIVPKIKEQTKPQRRRNNRSAEETHENLSSVNSIGGSPILMKDSMSMLRSKPKRNYYKNVNSTTIPIEGKSEVRSTKKPIQKELFNNTYQRFQNHIKEKDERLNNLRRAKEERESKLVTAVPKINKGKLAPSESDFLTRQKAYNQKVKEKKEKLEKEAKSKIDKELNIVSKQANKINKEDVNNSLFHFNEWEQKKKDKINQMKKTLEEKEIAEINNGKLHKGVKCNINEACNRLYKDDVKKRQETKEMLQTMFKPAFKPTINSGKKKPRKEKDLTMEKTGNSNDEAVHITHLTEEKQNPVAKDFIADNYTDALREKLFRNRPRFLMKESSTNNQSVRGTDGQGLSEME